MDAYGTDAGFVAYHTARGRAATVAAYDDDEIAPARLVASEKLDSDWRSLFPGIRTGGQAQVREWPRTGGVDIYGYGIPGDAVPVLVENATYELTLVQLQSPGSLTISFTPSKYKRVSVDGAVSAEYVTGISAVDMQTDFKIVGDILAPLFSMGGSDMSPLSGGVCRV